MKNIDLKRSISLDDIIDRASSQTVYRNLEKYEGIFLETRFKGVKLYGGRLDCVIDPKTYNNIKIIIDHNKKMFPKTSLYVKECIFKWTEIYAMINNYDDIRFSFELLRRPNNGENIDKMLTTANFRFELDYDNLQNILIDNKDKIDELKNNFARHLDMVLFSATTSLDLAIIRDFVKNNNAIRNIIDILEREKLLPEKFVDNLKYIKNDSIKIDCTNIEKNGRYLDKLKNIMMSYPIGNLSEDNERFIFDNIRKICLIEDEKNKKLNKKFEILSDYTSMCVKEYTNIYYQIYDNHPSIYRYALGKENEKSVYNNFVNKRIGNKKDVIYNIDIDREAVLDSWFKSNYHLFGFTNIYKSDIRNIDYICEYGNSYIYVELEYLSSNFIKHGHDPNIVDMVICYKKDIDLSMPVIEIENLRV